jgi:hypothetical protein
MTLEIILDVLAINDTLWRKISTGKEKCEDGLAAQPTEIGLPQQGR